MSVMLLYPISIPAKRRNSNDRSLILICALSNDSFLTASVYSTASRSLGAISDF